MDNQVKNEIIIFYRKAYEIYIFFSEMDISQISAEI